MDTTDFSEEPTTSIFMYWNLRNVRKS